jgi:hypothetical protein
MNAAQKPWTLTLINVALRIGDMVVMHFKRKYARVRPSTLFPGLLPPFGPPRHASFPSGHSLQGHLISEMLLHVKGIKDTHEKELMWLAERVAKNRERIGVHYESDSAAGAKMAAKLAVQLKDGGIQCASYQALLQKIEAGKEWPA